MMTTTKPHLHPQLVKEDINCSVPCDTGNTVPTPSNNNDSLENPLPAKQHPMIRTLGKTCNQPLMHDPIKLSRLEGAHFSLLDNFAFHLTPVNTFL